MEPNYLTSLPYDILFSISLHVEYDDLKYYRLANKRFLDICHEEIFWLTKIERDWGIKVLPNNGKNLQNLYIQIATSRYYPVTGSEHYAESCRDFYRLIFAAATLGKPIDNLVDKYHRTYKQSSSLQAITLSSLITMGNTIYDSDKSIERLSKKYSNLDVITGLIICHRSLPLDNKKLVNCYGRAAAITGDISLFKNVIPDLEIFYYAALFDNLSIFDFLSSSNKLSIVNAAAALGTVETIDYVYRRNREWDNKEELLYQALIHGNFPIVSRMGDAGLIIRQEMLESAAELSTGKFLATLIKLYPRTLSPEELDSLIFFAASYSNLSTVSMLDELGADIDHALFGAVYSNRKKMVENCLQNGANDYNQALLVAIAELSDKVIPILLDAGATNLDEAMIKFITNFDENYLQVNSQIIQILISRGITNFGSLIKNSSNPQLIKMMNGLGVLIN